MIKFISEKTIPIQNLKKTILEYLNSIPGKEEINSKILRLATRIESTDLLAWLKGQSFDKKIYWNDKKVNFEVAGIGATDHISGLDLSDYSSIIKRIHKYSGDKCSKCHYYGGFSFYKEEAEKDEWQLFGAYNFILPTFEIIRDAEGVLFVCNLLHPDENSLIHLARELESVSFKNVELKADFPGISEVTYWPGYDQWRDMINSALRDINEKEFDKIVLARKIEINLFSKVDPFSILTVLRNSNHQTVSFCFQPGPEATFLGATPEILYRREGRAIISEAVAGTRPRGKDQREDQDLANDLITNDKELREHYFVTKSLERNLGKLCSQVESNQNVSVMKFAQIQHLYTLFKGSLFQDVTDGDILECIHPTPAVGGYPDKAVLPLLHSTEPFNRGWYAAPIGWTAADSATFAVAIRSALVIKNKLILYSGAGIVEGSSPEREWDELENKIYHFKKVLGVDGKSLEEYQQLLGLPAYR